MNPSFIYQYALPNTRGIEKVSKLKEGKSWERLNTMQQDPDTSHILIGETTRQQKACLSMLASVRQLQGLETLPPRL